MSIEPSVILVDDDPAVRDSLTLLLDTIGFKVESYDSAEAFLQGFHTEKPACLVLDVNMPGMTGPELQAELIRRNIQLPIIFLTAHGDIPMTVRAIKTGAIDFLTKPVQGKLLVERVTAALRQDAERRERASQDQALHVKIATLTPREMDVMALAVAGNANKEIARHLGISHRTVEIHRARVMEKTGASSLVELARIYNACKSSQESET